MNECSLHNLSSRYLLDNRVLEMKRRKMIKDKDIPRWLSALLLTTLCFAIPIYVYFVNPDYLMSSHGYANGVETYTYTVEALHAKNLIQSKVTNFWFDGGSLGYPLFINTQPFPNFFIATVMVILERWVSPLRVFRWIIIMLITILPIAWYKAARNFRFTRIQSISFALLTLSVDSQLQTGFELDAYFLHGYLPQLFAMLFMPLAASKIYLHGLHLNNKDHSQAVFFTCLTYLSHINVGFYCSCLSLVTMILFILAKEFNIRDIKEALKRFFNFHITMFIYLSWWLIPLLISYPYNGKSSQKMTMFSLTALVDLYTNGYLFDYRQKYIWITCLVTIGLCIAVKNLHGLCNFSTLQINQQQLFTTWLLSITVLSIFLFVETSIANFFRRILPCDLSKESTVYLFGLQFCGFLFASLSISSMIDLVTYCTSRRFVKRMINICVVTLFALIMIRSSGSRVSERVTLVEVSDDFVRTLDSIKAIPKDGRLIAHEKLGTGGPWDLVNIPYLTGKSGVFIPGSKDTLSSFYLDSFILSESISQNQFINLLSLYNIQFLVASSSILESSTMDLSSFQHVTTIYDMQFHQVLPDDYNFGYFDIVRLPGYINGNLNHVRQPVSKTLDLFSKEVLFYLNPSKESDIMKKSIINAHVVDVSFSEKLSGNKDLSLVHWNYKNKETDSDQALQSLNAYYRGKWSSSIIVEQKMYGTEYHAIVHVTNHEGTQFELLEHLLLKVSYHPFWRCNYFPIDNEYLLEEYDPTVKQEKRKSVTIYHVTPNLMAITLPPGKYHVIFRYRFPGILKIMALVSVVVLINTTFKCNLRNKLIGSVQFIYNLLLIGMLKMFNKIRRYIWILLDKDFLSVKKYPFATILAPIDRLFKNKYQLMFLPNIRDVKMKTFTKSLSNIFQKYNSTEIPVNEIEVKTKECDSKLSKEEFVQQETLKFNSVNEVETCDWNRVVQQPPTPPKHVKKSFRKKQIRRGSYQNTMSLSTIGGAIDEVIGDGFNLISSELCDIVKKSSKSDSDLAYSVARRPPSDQSSKSESISPIDDLMNTEDIYISDSYVYNSDISNDDILDSDSTEERDNDDIQNSDDKDDLLSSEIFRTTWVAEKEDEDELDLNKSLDISFDDSGSNTPDDDDDHNSSEFSSSPNEHSSPDDSFEYRKECESLEESTQSKNEVVLSSDLYCIHMPDSCIQTCSQPQRRCTIAKPNNQINLNLGKRADSCQT